MAFWGFLGDLSGKMLQLFSEVDCSRVIPDIVAVSRLNGNLQISNCLSYFAESILVNFWRPQYIPWWSGRTHCLGLPRRLVCVRLSRLSAMRFEDLGNVFQWLKSLGNYFFCFLYTLIALNLIFWVVDFIGLRRRSNLPYYSTRLLLFLSLF